MRVFTFIMVVQLATLAHAQEKPEYLLKKEQTNKREPGAPCKCEPPPAPKPKRPWQFKLRIGSVFQLSQSRAVVGRIDGTTRSFNLDIHGEANWRCRRHAVRNRLDTNDLIVKTQNTGRWVHAADFVELESIYQYHAHPKAGPFTRAGLRTSVFLGRDLRTNAVRYDVPGGELTSPRTELRLTDRFVPLTLVQSVGAFVNPVQHAQFDVDLRGGLGIREVFADGQLGLKDDAMTTDIVELVELRSYAEAGLELIAMMRAELWDEKISTYAGVELLLPLVRTREPGDERSATELISKTVRVGVAYKLAKSATILYELRLVHQPQLIDAVQVLNNFCFKATFNLL
jgi:hypothetical protein